MASVRTLTRSFATGEVSPELTGRLDLAKYHTGLKLCRNFMPLPHGPVTNRAGTEMVTEVLDSTKRTRLIPFVFNDQQAFVLEMSPGQIRIVASVNGLAGLVLNGAGTAPLQVATSYIEGHLFGLHYTQSADVMTIVHQGYPVAELKRVSATSWTMSTPTFVPTTLAPSGTPTATATTGTGSISYSYCITAVAPDTLEESVASATSNAVTNNLPGAVGNKNTLTWSAVSGALRYNIYRILNGVPAYVGTAIGTTWEDVNYTPDTSRTPPNSVDPFVGAGNYPGAVAYFEQRRWFAGTALKPLNVWATRSGTESNLSYSIPARADDRLSFRAAARQGEAIRHLVPMSAILMLTASTEWRVGSDATGALTPTNIAARPQSYVGASPVVPVVIGGNVLYAAARGGRVRSLDFDYNKNSWTTSDVCKLAPHLFDGYTVSDMALARTPVPTLWVVRSDGVLLSCTWMPDEQVVAWAQHTTDGVFESCCVIPEDDEDRLYLVVRRTINGNSKRFIERMRKRRIQTFATDAWFVDCGLQYNGAPATTISGLDHLIGKTVSILADGVVLPPREVFTYVKPDTSPGGQVFLDAPASVVTVGLPITADMETLPLAAEVDSAFGQGREMSVNRMYLRVVDTSAFQAGQSFTRLTEYPTQSPTPVGAATNLTTGLVEVKLKAGYDPDGTVCVRVTDPVPVTINSMALQVSMGGV